MFSCGRWQFPPLPDRREHLRLEAFFSIR
jgi:hypothetical protein